MPRFLKPNQSGMSLLQVIVFCAIGSIIAGVTYQHTQNAKKYDLLLTQNWKLQNFAQIAAGLTSDYLNAKLLIPDCLNSRILKNPITTDFGLTSDPQSLASSFNQSNQTLRFSICSPSFLSDTERQNLFSSSNNFSDPSLASSASCSREFADVRLSTVDCVDGSLIADINVYRVERDRVRENIVRKAKIPFSMAPLPTIAPTLNPSASPTATATPTPTASPAVPCPCRFLSRCDVGGIEFKRDYAWARQDWSRSVGDFGYHPIISTTDPDDFRTFAPPIVDRTRPVTADIRRLDFAYLKDFDLLPLANGNLPTPACKVTGGNIYQCRYKFFSNFNGPCYSNSGSRTYNATGGGLPCGASLKDPNRTHPLTTDSTIQKGVVNIFNYNQASCRLDSTVDSAVYGGGCLGGDTEIRMADGNFAKIKNLKTDSSIRNPITGRSTRILSVVTPKDQVKIFEVRLSNQRKLIISGAHRILTSDELKRADELLIGDEITMSANRFEKVVEIKQLTTNLPTMYNLILEVYSDEPQNHLIETKSGVVGDLFLQEMSE